MSQKLNLAKLMTLLLQNQCKKDYTFPKIVIWTSLLMGDATSTAHLRHNCTEITNFAKIYLVKDILAAIFDFSI